MGVDVQNQQKTIFYFLKNHFYNKQLAFFITLLHPDVYFIWPSWKIWCVVDQNAEPQWK